MQLDPSLYSPSMENSSLSDHTLPDRSQFLRALTEENIPSLSTPIASIPHNHHASAEPHDPAGAKGQGSSPDDKGNAPSSGKTFKANPGEHWYRGIRYASRSEAACGELMERYIPGFKVVELQTFQVPIYDHSKGTTKTVDFFHDGAFIEYHPPRFWREGKKFGDFKNAKEYFDYRGHLKSLTTPQEKREYREEIQEKLSERYADERRAIISRFKGGAEIDLIVAKDASDVYDRIILRFSPKPPSKAEFMRAFHAIELELKEIESDSKKSLHHRNFKRP